MQRHLALTSTLALVTLLLLWLQCADAALHQSHAQSTTPNGEGLFEIVNEWKYLDFEYPTYVQRQRAIAKGDFVVENNLPLGIDHDAEHGRLFVTTPRWKDGVPASLSWLPYPATERSPALRPYPDWEAHGDPYAPDCQKLISVYRTALDSACQRLWLIDAGIVNATIQLQQICPPKIRAYDLNTNALVHSYELPAQLVRQDSLHSNVLIDRRAHEACDDAHIYVSDVWRYGLVVYSVAKQRAWRVTNYHFQPEPQAADFNVYDLNFQWLDGVFGMALSLEQPTQQAQSRLNRQQPRTTTTPTSDERMLYFHPMASYKEFIVSTRLLRDESVWTSATGALTYAQHIVALGDRGVRGQSSTAGVARNGVMFYTQVHRDDVACWDTAKPYVRRNLMQLLHNNAQSNGSTTTNSLIQFPNDLKVDAAAEQSVWVMSNRLPVYLYSQLDYTQVNFRILRIGVQEAIADSVCAPWQGGYSAQDAQMLLLLNEGQCF